MCTLVILRRPRHPWPIIIGANRDEMMARPWRAPGRHWSDRPEVLGGLDELGGGTWLGINDHGVVAGILNRTGTLGPLAGRRSRGELVLEALDHADADQAAAALKRIEPASYRPFGLVIADNRDVFWLRHTDPAGHTPVTVQPLPPGLHMVADGDPDDRRHPRIRAYLPRFAAASPPDPGAGEWSSWEALLGSGIAPADMPEQGMNFALANGFATLSSSLVALPGLGERSVRPVFRFATRRPEAEEWADIPITPLGPTTPIGTEDGNPVL